MATRGRLGPTRKVAPRALSAALAALLVVLPACVQNDGSRNPLRSVVEVGVEDERQVGYQADIEIQASLRKIDRLIEDPLVLSFIHELGQSMVATLGDQPFTYRFRVIADRQLNAFALPGGAIYFNSGTILSAASLGELAGVMAHEIAHVKGRHYARMVEAAAIPSLLAQLGGIAATAATGKAEPLIVAQGVNVALQLAYTREYEAEADTLATAFMARAGYRPDAVVPFFERVLAEREAPGIEIPPYLYSHPAVESRIATARRRAEDVTVTGTVPPRLARAFRIAQLRLGILTQARRTSVRLSRGQPEPRAEPALAEAEKWVQQGEPERALDRLEAAIQEFPSDPRPCFRRGELLEKAGRLHDAAAAFSCALALDPDVALNYYRLGLVHMELGDNIQATFHLEQAARRFERTGTLRRRTDEALARLVFPVVIRGGLGDGDGATGADTPAGRSRERFGDGDDQAMWWGWIGPRYAHRRNEILVRWFDPSGQLVHEDKAEALRRPTAGAKLALSPDLASRHGIWRVEARLDDHPVDRRTFRMEPADAASQPAEPATK